MKARSYGERGLFVRVDGEASTRARRTLVVAEDLRATFPSADVVVGGGCVAVFSSDLAPIREWLDGVDSSLDRARPSTSRIHVLPAVYDGADLDELAQRAGLSREAVIDLHVARTYVDEIVGFLPGFAYLGEVDPRIAAPRRASPRPRIDPGSIGIAGPYTGVYPLASPGGWNLVGRVVGAELVCVTRDPPALIAPGDAVRFERVDDPVHAVTGPPSRSAFAAASGGIRVLSAPPGATVQDLGRRDQVGRGLPPSGPLDTETFAMAHRALGNSPSAAALEIPLGRAEFMAQEPTWVSIDGDRPIRVEVGESLSVPACERAVRYLAVAGGFHVPVVAGSRGTLAVARLGGYEGRGVRRGDVLPVGSTSGLLPPDAALSLLKRDDDAVLVVDPGPELDLLPPRALEVLLALTWRISRLGDRVGVRLEGERIPRDGGDFSAPRPMVRGAIQVSTDGTPIVLGPDHPTTGGYPVLAVLRASSQAKLARLRPGAELRFRLGF